MNILNLPKNIFTIIFEYSHAEDSKRLQMCRKNREEIVSAAAQADFNRLRSLFQDNSIFLEPFFHHLKGKIFSYHDHYPRKWGDKWNLDDNYLFPGLRGEPTGYSPLQRLMMRAEQIGQKILANRNNHSLLEYSNQLEKILIKISDIPVIDNEMEKGFALHKVALIASYYGGSDLANRALDHIQNLECGSMGYVGHTFLYYGHSIDDLPDGKDKDQFSSCLGLAITLLVRNGNLDEAYQLAGRYKAIEHDIFYEINYDEIIAAFMRVGRKEEAFNIFEQSLQIPRGAILAEFLLQKDWTTVKKYVDKIDPEKRDDYLHDILESKKGKYFFANCNLSDIEEYVSLFIDEECKDDIKQSISKILGETGNFQLCCEVISRINAPSLQVNSLIQIGLKSCLLMGGNRGFEYFKKNCIEFFQKIFFSTSNKIFENNSIESPSIKALNFINDPDKSYYSGNKIELYQIAFFLAKSENLNLAQDLLCSLDDYFEACVVAQQIAHWLKSKGKEEEADCFLQDQLLGFLTLTTDNLFLAYEAIGRISKNNSMRKTLCFQLREKTRVKEAVYSFFEEVLTS